MGGAARRSRERKAISSRAGIASCTSATNPSKWHIWTAGAVRRFVYRAANCGDTLRASLAAPRATVCGGPLTRLMTNRLRGLAVVVIAALMAGACASGRAFRQGEASMRAGDLDDAVVNYRRAVQADPDNPRYKIA